MPGTARTDGDQLMRMEIDPADERAFGKLSRRLQDGFERWAAARSLPVDPFVVGLVLDYKGRYADGHLGCWIPANLRDMLCEWFPRKATMEDETIEQTVPTVAAFIDYLASSGLLTDVSAPPDELKAALKKLVPTFRANMSDPARSGSLLRRSSARPPRRRRWWPGSDGSWHGWERGAGSPRPAT